MCHGGGVQTQTRANNRSQPLTSPFASLSLKGSHVSFTIKGGDATKGPLATQCDGPRPVPWTTSRGVQGKFQPMRKQGAIILATGGDDSNRAVGNFCEGLMATGFAGHATDAKIQARFPVPLSHTITALSTSQLFVSFRLRVCPFAHGSRIRVHSQRRVVTVLVNKDGSLSCRTTRALLIRAFNSTTQPTHQPSRPTSSGLATK